MTVDTRQIHLGDCVDVMREWPGNSIHAIVCDPPYLLGFMGVDWEKADSGDTMHRWHFRWCIEARRILKPGGHLVAFSGTRTFHRMYTAAEAAGFELRDTLAWMYGEAMPHGADVSKAIDKAAGAKREVIREGVSGKDRNVLNAAIHPRSFGGRYQVTAPATEEAKRWDGWATALKPSWEPILLARKPMDGPAHENVLAHGTGALNTAACHIGDRWPANVILGHHPGCTEARCHPGCPVAELDRQSGVSVSTGGGKPRGRHVLNAGQDGSLATVPEAVKGYGDTGTASRFFYKAKASRAERWFHCGQCDATCPGDDLRYHRDHEGLTHHPTQKPEEVMSWLVQLVTPPGGIVLDPFMGSGTTGVAATRLDRDWVGVELDPIFHGIATDRIARALNDLELERRQVRLPFMEDQ